MQHVATVVSLPVDISDMMMMSLTNQCLSGRCVLCVESYQIWLDVYRRKIATPFRLPVDTKVYANYTDFVRHPISLFDIRENIGAAMTMMLLPTASSTTAIFINHTEILLKSF
jgi:hypothetical protein